MFGVFVCLELGVVVVVTGDQGVNLFVFGCEETWGILMNTSVFQ